VCCVRTKIITIGSAVIGFALCYGSMASSAIQTIPSGLCHYSAVEIDCAIVGGTWTSAGVSRVYVDGHSNSGTTGQILLDLRRYSHSGTLTEQVGLAQFHSGNFRVAFQTPVMSTNPSQWDYYTFTIMYTVLDQGKFSISGLGVSSNW
jgi:hypothetical protein